jgi:hypothetical protein
MSRGLRQLESTESQHQALFFKWLDYVTINSMPLRPHCYAVPNGGSRNKAEAARLKAQGVTAGVADISIDIPSGYWHGLRIEMKRPGERATEEQETHIVLRSRMGYCAQVCEGFDAARRATLDYLIVGWGVVDRWMC